MEQIVRVAELRFARWSIPTIFAIDASTMSASWRRLIQPLLELEVMR